MSLVDISIACHLGFVNLRVPHYFPGGASHLGERAPLPGLKSHVPAPPAL